ncbi:MAG: TolC family protein [Planctomycetaceae bacterium]
MNATGTRSPNHRRAFVPCLTVAAALFLQVSCVAVKNRPTAQTPDRQPHSPRESASGTTRELARAETRPPQAPKPVTRSSDIALAAFAQDEPAAGKPADSPPAALPAPDGAPDARAGPAAQDQKPSAEEPDVTLPDEPVDMTAEPGASDEPVVLRDAPLETSDVSYPINLATALRLSDARPLIVAAAQASAWVAEAELQRAQVLWVPSLNMGADYIRHDGFGPDFNRGINTPQRPLNQNINFLYAGGGITQNVAMTDAIFEPLAARQVLNSRRWDIQAAKNDALLATARAYFRVHQYRGQYAAALDVVDRGRKLVNRLTGQSQDLVPRIEVDRAKSQLAHMEQKAASAREEWRVASADLTEVLRLDPRVVVEPAEPDHLQITLIDPGRPLDELIPIGLTNRPELASQQAIVGAVAQRIRRERGRILMPSLMLNGFQTPYELIQFGAQGIGHDRSLNLWSARDDFSPQVIWQWQAMGLGNHARIKEQRGEQSRAMVDLFKVQDSVAAEVTRSQARLQSAAVRVVQAERGLRESRVTFDGNFEGLRQTKRFDNVLIQIYRPQEAVIALDHLMVAYDAYIATVADYNRAQFEVFHAMGYPASEITAVQPPGDVVPVDTNRPSYLPPVGEGPPAATR